jgi:hypothetical protein
VTPGAVSSTAEVRLRCDSRLRLRRDIIVVVIAMLCLSKLKAPVLSRRWISRRNGRERHGKNRSYKSDSKTPK